MEKLITREFLLYSSLYYTTCTQCGTGIVYLRCWQVSSKNKQPYSREAAIKEIILRTRVYANEANNTNSGKTEEALVGRVVEGEGDGAPSYASHKTQSPQSRTDEAELGLKVEHAQDVARHVAHGGKESD